MIRGGVGVSYFTARFGFTGGAFDELSIGADQTIGVASDFKADGTFTTIPAFTPFRFRPTASLIPRQTLGCLRFRRIIRCRWLSALT
ncbi:MAG: hypothetical protein U0Y68_14195 [Blastocatellia bacterium]